MSKAGIAGIVVAVIVILGIAYYVTQGSSEEPPVPVVTEPQVKAVDAGDALAEAEAEGAKLFAQKEFEKAEAAARAAEEARRNSAAEAAAKAAEARRLAEQARRAAKKNMERGSTYTVREGDNLWELSKSKFAFENPWVWPLLWEANKDLVSNPHHIEVGWELKVPGREVAAADVERSKRLIYEADTRY